ncbi:MAG: hypothetical protein HC771_13070 [Synechococcales cyanobacterium CRU_2_2]|nr:hypothetical protein [Synechococcales cyanobacterium CRU_2_2]
MFSSLPIVGIGGKVLKLRALSLFDRQFFSALHAKALEILGDRPISEAYDDDEAFRGLIDAALLMCGISTSSIDMQTMVSLLFGIGDVPPVIIELNFPKPSREDSSESPSEDLSDFDPDAWAVAAIWNATEDPVQAMAIATATPWVFFRRSCAAAQSKSK